MIEILFDDMHYAIPMNFTLADFLSDQKVNTNYCAIAINGVFIPRIQYVATSLRDGDIIAMLQAMQGG